MVVASSPAQAPTETGSAWSLGQRIAFRFAFAYWVLFLAAYMPQYFSSTPGLSWLGSAPDVVTHRFVPWIGARVLHLARPITIFTNGSGDTTFDYVLILSELTVAVIGTILWSLLDRRRTAYSTLYEGLRVLLRYCLAIAMVNYGLSKIVGTQFSFPRLDRLIEPYGESSPMGLLWTFMGYSKPYAIFAGSMETLGGLLLFWRRTTLIGALLITAAMVNVVAINFAYDVPVKLYSVHLLLMAIFLALPDARRLLDALVLSRSRPLSEMVRGRRSMAIAKAALLAGLVIPVVVDAAQSRARIGDGAPKPPLYGLYTVEAFARNGQPVPPLLGDGTRWRRVLFTQFGGLSVYAADDAIERYRLIVDTVKRTITATDIAPNAPVTKMTLNYAEPASKEIVLNGTAGGDTIEARLRRIDESSFLLINQGFHWINERPLNR